MMMSRIPERFHAVDMHNHVWLDGSGKLNYADMESTVKSAARFGIERVAVSCPILTDVVEPETFRHANDVVLEAVKLYPKLFFGLCFVDPAFPKEAVAEIERCVKAGMRGIKLYHQHFICDEVQRPLMECAARLGIPVLMHAGRVCDELTKKSQPRLSGAEHFMKALKMFPDTTLIQAHIGGGGDWEQELRVLAGLRNPHYYIDISGSVCDVGIVRRTVDAVGIDSVLFATDMSFGESVAKALYSGLSEAELQKLFHDNWAKIEAMKK